MLGGVQIKFFVLQMCGPTLQTILTTGHLYQNLLKTSLRYGHDYNTCIITILKVEFPEIIKITNIEVYVAVSVEHITKISVLDRIQTSFVTVYEATATAGMSNEVLTIDLDSVSYIIGGQHIWNHCFRPYTVTWLE